MKPLDFAVLQLNILVAALCIASGNAGILPVLIAFWGIVVILVGISEWRDG
jgi:hypothetical protein